MGPEANRGDVVAAHAQITPRDRLIAERRALYEFAASLAAVSVPRIDDVLDSPISRAMIGRLLGESALLARSDMVAVSELAPARSKVEAGRVRLAVASTPAARLHLRDALGVIAGHAADVDIATWRPALLISGDPGFASVLDTIAAGVQLSRTIDTELMDDLIPHISLVAVLDRDGSGRLGSASAREYPGLVVLPRPLTAIEVAEALVHEGAHQKVFDLAITRDLFGKTARDCRPHRPHWAPPNVAWPLEQVFAAWHAYLCLARFDASLSDDIRTSLGPGSLLPLAADRSEYLGRQLVSCGRYLGRDAHSLIETLLGTAPVDRWVDVAVDIIADARRVGSGGRLMVRSLGVGSRTLAGWTGSFPQVFWVESPERLLTDCDERAGGTRGA